MAKISRGNPPGGPGPATGKASGDMTSRLKLTRGQILGHRRTVAALDNRLPPGTRSWRRGEAKLSIEPWRHLLPTERDAVEAEAASLPLPGLRAPIQVGWVD